MKSLSALAAICMLACAIPGASKHTQTLRAAPTPVSVRSNSRSDVDVYVLCGQRDARWLGVVRAKEGALFEVTAAQRRCVSGLNFFLVRRDFNRGYWVGPLYPKPDSRIDLVIEKYVGLSAARVRSGQW